MRKRLTFTNPTGSITVSDKEPRAFCGVFAENELVGDIVNLDIAEKPSKLTAIKSERGERLYYVVGSQLPRELLEIKKL
jgi:hypothetical protein